MATWWLRTASQACGWFYLALSCGLATTSLYGTQVWFLTCLAARPAAFVLHVVTHAAPQCLHLLAAWDLFGLSPAACIVLLASIPLCPSRDLSHESCIVPCPRHVAVSMTTSLLGTFQSSDSLHTPRLVAVSCLNKAASFSCKPQKQSS